MIELLDKVLFANIYLQPIFLSLAILTNILNMCILKSSTLRSSPCTYYFLAYAIISIVYISISSPTQFLRGFHIDWSKGKLNCKLFFYILYLLPFQANLMLLLASFDRYYSSLKYRHFRSKKPIQTTKLTILLGIILSSIYMSPMSIIYYWNERDQICQISSHLIVHIYVCSQLFLYYLLAPCLMIVFGFLTISNIRRQASRVNYLYVSNRRHRLERQLTFMLFLQVGIHLMLILPFGIIYSLNVFKPLTRTNNILAWRYLLLMWQYLDYILTFFLYVLSGRIYCQQFFRLVNMRKNINQI